MVSALDADAKKRHPVAERNGLPAIVLGRRREADPPTPAYAGAASRRQARALRRAGDDAGRQTGKDRGQMLEARGA